MGRAVTTVKKVKLSEIKPDLANANRHTERGHAMLRDSISEHGFAEAGTLDKEGRIIGGNHRFEVAGDLLGSDEAIIIEVDGKQPVFIQRNDIDLATPEGRRLAYALNRVAQVSIVFDPEQMAIDIAEGVNLDGMFYEGEIETLLAGVDGWDGESTEDNNNYVRKIEAPTYTPTGDKPDISQLYDDSKAKALIKAIDEADIPEAEKVFLRAAAQRHIVFNFRNIAEYYSHSSQDLQDLFEDSALVIIDFNKAIENGFVQLTHEIAELVREEYGDD